MKKLYFLSLVLGLFISTNLLATTHTIGISGISYTPDVVNAAVGDTVNFVGITTNHPTVQVTESAWNANNVNSLPDNGFGAFANDFTIILTSDMMPTIFYVCANHVANGMKGLINITMTGITELPNNTIFEIGPNPIKDQQLSYSVGIPNFSHATMTILDVQGKEVGSYNITDAKGSITLDLRSGNYFIRLTDDENALLVTKKLIIQ